VGRGNSGIVRNHTSRERTHHIRRGKGVIYRAKICGHHEGETSCIYTDCVAPNVELIAFYCESLQLVEEAIAECILNIENYGFHSIQCIDVKMTALVFAAYLVYSRLKIKIYLYRLKLTAPRVRHNYVYVQSGFHAQHEIVSSPGLSLRIHVE
jgi:hypothetical protein